MRPARHLWRAFRPTLLLLAGTFALGLALATQAGFFGIPLAAILLTWFGKYLFVIVDRVAHGFDEPPVLSLEMISPFSDWRGLALVAIVGLTWLATSLLVPVVGDVAAVLLRGALLATLPAIVAILAIEGNPLAALSPSKVWRVAHGLGWWYPALFGAAIAAGALGYAAASGLPLLVLQLFATLALILMLASLLGGALYERRDALGIDAWYSPERAAARRARETRIEHNRFMDEVFALARNNSHANAWRAIEQRLEQHAHADAEYDWLLEDLARLDDRRHLERLRQAYLSRLIRARRAADALKLTERIWHRSPDFLPAEAAATLTLARIALDSGSQRSARKLLDRFEQRFPNHAATDLARQLAAQLTRLS